MKATKYVALMLFLMLPIAHAATLSVFAPDTFIEGQQSQVNFSINGIPFDGTLGFQFSNINSSITNIGFFTANFQGEYYNFTLYAKGYLSGTYTILATLFNSSSLIASSTKSGIVNSSVPVISSVFPNGIVSEESATLIVRTNEIARCKFDSSDKKYEDMASTFENTDKVFHNSTLSGLSQGELTYYVRCQDQNNYTMNESAVIKFKIDLAPGAEIVLSDPDPVKEGTIVVTVHTSEALDKIPSLEYSFNTAPADKRIISLAGSGSVWKGYMIITPEDDNKVGTFFFNAVDNSGTIGTRIKEGNLFVVDTRKPSAPQSLKAVSQPDGAIRLTWYYDGEEPDYFNIYRSLVTGTNYVDFYTQSNGTEVFIDRSTVDKATYFYKIGAVDYAGNEGSLSEEVFATALNQISSEAEEIKVEVPKVLPPGLVPKVDSKIKEVERLIIDVKDVQQKLQLNSGEKMELIKELKLAEQASSSLDNLDSLKKQLESFKDNYAAEEELDIKLAGADKEIQRIEKSTPKDAEILEKSEFLQGFSADDIHKAIEEISQQLGFNENDRNQYEKINSKNKDKFRNSVRVRTISVKYLDSTSIEKTTISKTLSYESPESLSDIIVIETIPKSIASSASEIEVAKSTYEVLKEDPILKFGFVKFTSEGQIISYSLPKKVNLEDIKNTKTVILLSPTSLVGNGNKVTGSSIFSLKSLGFSSWQSILMWIGVSMIMGLGTYYYVFVRDNGYMYRKMNRKSTLRNLENEVNFGLDYPYKVYSNREIPHLSTARPFSNAPEESQIINDDNTITFMNALINKAHLHLDNFNTHEAAKIYPKIQAMYQKLPQHLRAGVYGKCAELNRRIRDT